MLLSTSSKVSPTVVDPARSVVLFRFDMIRKNLGTQPDSLLAPRSASLHDPLSEQASQLGWLPPSRSVVCASRRLLWSSSASAVS